MESMSNKFSNAMEAIFSTLPDEQQMPPIGLNAWLDDLLWLNLNRGPGEHQDNIKNEIEGVMAALGAIRDGGIPADNFTNQNAGKVLSKIHPQSIKIVLNDGTLLLETNNMFNSEDYINCLPEEVKYIWSSLAYIEGFTYLLHGALVGWSMALNKAREYFNIASKFCPSEAYIKEGINKLTQIETALESYTKRSKVGCFIATVALGSPYSQEISTLYRWRDDVLLKCSSGRFFVYIYCKFSQKISKVIQHNQFSKHLISKCFIKPLCKMINKKYPEHLQENMFVNYYSEHFIS